MTLLSCFHPQLFEVELALDQPERGVVDLTAVAELDDRAALGRDDATLDLLVLDPFLGALGGLVRVRGGEVPGPVLQPGLQPSNGW